MDGRVILHVDMDAFYASIEQRDDASLRGRPVIVGGTGGRGVVAAASYEVRSFGVRSAMPIKEALRRCPQAVCIRPRMAHYASVSRQIFGIFNEFTPLVQGLSLDEAFLDVTAGATLDGDGERVARQVKHLIRERTALAASVGVAPNKLVAKIASDLEKPDGLVVVRAAEVNAVLDPLPVRALFGLGAKTAAKVEALGIRTLGQLRLAEVAKLRAVFGRHAERVRQRAAGIDDRPVVPDRDEKQISAEETFDADISEPARLRSELVHLADRVGARLRAKGLTASCVVVKIRRGDFVTCTRQRQFEPPTQETQVLTAIALELFESWRATAPDSALRLLGVGVSGLASASQLELFTAPQTTRNRKLDATVDRIRERFGRVAVARASTLSTPAGQPARGRRR
ncbi:MAG TPA: DNA polymerase IV [Steroidobacteraceae bacterium]|nr:DNA polymerase IV [Steroidobacteraceae bacterium]